MIDPESTNPAIPATPQVLREAEALSGDIIKDIEFGRASLSAIGLKALRLARILNDSQVQETFVRESAGSDSTKSTEELENTVAKGRAVLQSALELPSPYEGKWALQEMGVGDSRTSFPTHFTLRLCYS